jgi:FAD binding domain/Berberine and berberine like
MGDLRATLSTGESTVLNTARVHDFKAGLGGDIVLPEDADYEAARGGWNGMIDKHPALVVRCRGVGDVKTAIAFAREHNLLVAVRGGGHSLPGFSTCDGGMVIDLSPLKGVRVDPVDRTVRAQAGVTWGEFDRETQAFGLATTGGAVSTTGIGGLTLGGGIGWLMRAHGLACDNLLSADLVTADGQFLTASPAQDADLFWALRGGGGNFGVVTSFQFPLHHIGPVLGGMVIYPYARAKEVLRFYRDFTLTAPNELTVYALMMTTPDGTAALAIVLCYCGPTDVGIDLVRPLQKIGPPLVDQIQQMPYCVLQTLFNAGFAPGLHNYYKQHYLTTISDDLIDVMVESFATVPSPLSALGFEQFGGAVARIRPDETAFPHRNAAYDVAILGVWRDGSESDRNIRWVREVATATEPFASGGVYVNFLADEGDERVRGAYGANYERLASLKAKYDPTNFFRLNQNIKAAAVAGAS